MLDPLQDASLQPQRRLRANRRLRYASSPIRAIVPVQRTGEQHQDMEICNPCPPTFLLPISPAGHVPLAPEYNMGGFLRRNELNAFVSQSAHVNPLEQSLSPAQQDRRDSDVQLIDEARTKILLDSVRSAANAHIHSVGCVARPVKRLVNTARDEVECRSAFHLDGRARVMSQDESWNVIGWVVPPPAFPVHVGPGTANRSEHVSSENPGANILEAPRSEVVIDPRCATVGAK